MKTIQNSIPGRAAIGLALLGVTWLGSCGNLKPAQQSTGSTSQGKETVLMKSIYDFTMKDINGKEISLEAYKGKVLLIVNVASHCGFTPQYEGLQNLYETYSAKGLVILGFPSNDFLGQEPGTDAEIQQFCSSKYHVTFPLFSKISVTGGDQHPLYAYLTGKDTNPEFSGKISWNFNKFLVNREGRIVARFGSRDKPGDDSVIKAIQGALE